MSVLDNFCGTQAEWEVYWKQAIDRFMLKVELDGKTGCWIWKGCTIWDGYGHFRFLDKMIRAHRFSFLMYYKREPKQNLVIAHTCNNIVCVNPMHLVETTQSVNMQHSMLSGNKSSILTYKEVQDIKKSNKNVSPQDLSLKFGVSIKTINRILSGKRWHYISEDGEWQPQVLRQD